MSADAGDTTPETPRTSDADADAVARLRAVGCVFAEDEVALLRSEAESADAFERSLRRREHGEPLEQIVGWAEFDGLRIGVAPGVFVPRLRTTAILTVVDALAASGEVGLESGARVLDLCCGTAALGAALLARHPGIAVTAADIDPVAVACARRNLPPTAVVVQGDLFAALPPHAEPFDIVVVNAPYVPTARIGEMPPEARLHEHLVALDGGSDGLALHARVASESAGWVRAGGVLLLETSREQADHSGSLFPVDEWRVEIVEDDDVDGTVILARRI